jgi:hypothetical protein
MEFLNFNTNEGYLKWKIPKYEIFVQFRKEEQRRIRLA